MNLEYKGRNNRRRIVWIDADYHEENKPLSNFEMEEWQVPRYRELVKVSEYCLGRKLTKKEASFYCWMSGFEESSCKILSQLVQDAYKNGRGLEKLEINL